MLEAYVEDDRSREELLADGFDPDVVERALALIDRAEYKRRQAPPGVKLRPKAFGRDRRTPITNRWPELSRCLSRQPVARARRSISDVRRSQVERGRANQSMPMTSDASAQHRRARRACAARCQSGTGSRDAADPFSSPRATSRRSRPTSRPGRGITQICQASRAGAGSNAPASAAARGRRPADLDTRPASSSNQRSRSAHGTRRSRATSTGARRGASRRAAAPARRARGRSPNAPRYASLPTKASQPGRSSRAMRSSRSAEPAKSPRRRSPEPGVVR